MVKTVCSVGFDTASAEKFQIRFQFQSPSAQVSISNYTAIALFGLLENVPNFRLLNKIQLMNALIVLSIVLILSIIGIALWFYNENNAIGRLHEQTISELERAIYKNRNQIRLRNSYLGRYNFLKYNLGEALVIQSEIVINGRYKKQ